MEEKSLEIKILTLPNVITYLNLAFGFISIFITATGRGLVWANLCIVLCGALDAADGFIARARNETSDYGKYLDSLADMVSFGVAPGLIFFNYFHQDFLVPALVIALVYVIAGASRLARFNVIDKADGFISGLPITVAGVISSLKWMFDIHVRNVGFIEASAIVLILSLLMLCKFQLRKPGFKNIEKE